MTVLVTDSVNIAVPSHKYDSSTDETFESFENSAADELEGSSYLK